MPLHMRVSATEGQASHPAKAFHIVAATPMPRQSSHLSIHIHRHSSVSAPFSIKKKDCQLNTRAKRNFCSWQGPSWSTRDQDNHWKPAHYAAQRFFAPLLVSGTYTPADGLVNVWLTSDLLQPLTGMQLPHADNICLRGSS